MRVAVFSHKPCWARAGAGFATDGGFPAQMRALSHLFDETTLVVPCAPSAARVGGTPLEGHALRVAPLSAPAGSGWRRKAGFPLWLVRNAPTLLRELARADAVHAPVPGDVGTVGLLLALAAGKPLFVRYCNNWFATRTAAERFWKWAMRRFAGGRNVMLATGGAHEPPAPGVPALRWIFATSLEEREIEACARLREAPSQDGPRLILVGRQEEGKGTAALIESLPEIARTWPGVSLEVLGDGSALEAFRRLAARAGVAERVRFRGNVDRATVVERLRAADLFCFPTASEGFPKVVLEALACGLPVLTTRVSVLPVLLERGAGMLLDDATPPRIAEGVRRCLADPAAYRRMSASALATAREYTLERWEETVGTTLADAWGPLRVSSADVAPVRERGARKAG